MPLQVNDGIPMRVLGFWLDMASWQAHCNRLHDQHRLLLARLTQCGLSGPNKILAYNWIMAGKVGYSAPLADLAKMAQTMDRAAAAAAKNWLGLHQSVSTQALYTPQGMGGHGLLNLEDEVTMCQATYLIKHVHTWQKTSALQDPMQRLFDALMEYLSHQDLQGCLQRPALLTAKALPQRPRGWWLPRAIESWKKLDLRWPRRAATRTKDFFLGKEMPIGNQKQLTV